MKPLQRIVTEASRDPRESPGIALRGSRRLALRQRAVILCLLLSDLVVGFAGLGAMFGGTLFAVEGEQITAGFANVFAVGILSSLLLWIMLRLFLGLYPGYGVDPAQELRLQTYSSVMALVMISFVALMLGVGARFVYLLLPIGVFSLVLTAPIARSATKWVLVRTGLWGKPVVVLGSGEMAARLVPTMLNDPGQGFRPVAVFSDEGTEASSVAVADVPYLGARDEAPDFARTYGINTAILAVGDVRSAGQERLADWASTRFERVIAVPNLTGLSSSATVARDLAGVLGVEVKHNLLDPRARRIKRTMDLAATVLGGILILPFFLVLCLLVWLQSGRSIFYKDQRLGRDGKLFSCIKFRTMVADAETVLREVLERDPVLREEYFRYHKLRADPRVTGIGRFLRKTSLDELPQLWNVLRGEMSLVGPRPYLPREVEDIGTRLPEISRVYPGITGLWQVSGRNHSSFAERVQMDAYYVRNWSVWLDLVILFRTVVILVLWRGAY